MTLRTSWNKLLLTLACGSLLTLGSPVNSVYASDDGDVRTETNADVETVSDADELGAQPARKKKKKKKRIPPADGTAAVSDAVNTELLDFARAMRSLDQSFYVRGFQGCGAAVGGSVFVDWRARGLPAPRAGALVIPPEPIILSAPRTTCVGAVTKGCCGTFRSPIHLESQIGCGVCGTSVPGMTPNIVIPEVIEKSLFVWQTERPVAWKLAASRVLFDASGAVVLGSGQIAVRGIDNEFSGAVAESKYWSVAFTATCTGISSMFEDVLVLGRDCETPRFSIGTYGGNWVLRRLQATPHESNPYHDIVLAPVVQTRQRITLNCQNHRLTVLVDGKPVGEPKDLDNLEIAGLWRLGSFSVSAVSLGQLTDIVIRSEAPRPQQKVQK